MKRVEITESGRGGVIYYHEGEHRLTFHWEFAGGDAIALLFGPEARHWDAQAPWAPGRQQEIFDFVAQDVVRRRVPGGSYTADLSSGVIEIRSGR